MDEVRQAALEWIAKAERDLEAAKRMIVCVDPLLDTGSYHCQQAAEKALKGWLTFRSVSVTKTHDLVNLERQCVKLDIDFQGLLEMADFLSPFAVDFRYPGDMFEPPLEEAEMALRGAEKIVVTIAEKIRNQASL
jgi:HEPN domain-containing protein